MKFFYHFIKILFIALIVIFTGCNKDDLSKADTLKLSLDGSPITQFVNQPFVFKVEANNITRHVTSESRIMVNGLQITGNQFTPTQEGNYTVKAYYQGIESNALVITAVPEPNDVVYSQKVLVEDYTGTWCGYCTRVWHAINLAKQQSNRVVSVAVHVDGNDPFKFDGSQLLKSTFGIGGLPAARINRTNTWTNPEHENIAEVTNQTGDISDLGLSVASVLNGNTVDFTVKVGFSTTISEQLNIVVYLVENGLIYNQVNYNSYVAGGQSPIVGFTHNDVLRALYTDVFGETIPAGETLEDNIYEKVFQKTIPSTVNASNYQNLHLVAFVIDATSKEVLNVQEVKVGETKDFD